MGLGRFLYTPMLPVMMAEGRFHLASSRGLPAATMRGIWLQSAIFVWRISPAIAPAPISVASALASGLLILAMAWLLPFFWCY